MSYIFPIKVLEHLSQANAVIASNVPGLASMIQHEHNGLLFEPGNSDDLARCILRLHDDLALWRKLSANAIESVRKYDVVDKNRTIFEEIGNSRKHRFS
jgi:glycosyltransferase involved in cell wall biosynthesis